MMDTLYYLASIAAVGWLVAWVLRGEGTGKPGGFWPFDMKPPAAPPQPERQTAPSRRGGRDGKATGP